MSHKFHSSAHGINGLYNSLVKARRGSMLYKGARLALHEQINWRIRSIHPDTADKTLGIILDTTNRELEERCLRATQQLCRNARLTSSFSDEEDTALIRMVLSGEYFKNFAFPDTQEGVI